ncbi:Eco57I restriction-modification methylase domain-containing protein [Paenibacillus qinlingensis]|uniref:Eco57I restriction-modification methylase domain-containing protein n=1 Tax=Paenibacillus qinlingensis TaxID=1837343 RepID=UPI00156362E3|nr:Eco57I restriction-modification methylase domain-containing protein [Paenibacillus qinlingensis]NQX63748.1 Eco57I restriction-modification methylase domain-containing protein [Paenibacillus qinlingensis]
MSQINTLAEINRVRQEVGAIKEKALKSELGQFFTNTNVASFMANLFDSNEPHIKLLDPGAGIGILTAAYIERLCKKKRKPISIEVVAVEIDESILPYLTDTLEFCSNLCQKAGITFSSQIVNRDFLEFGVESIGNPGTANFNVVIMNPPYKKISTDSISRNLLRQIGVETTNLYTGFVAVAKRLMVNFGQLVAITPRSFCNGTYYIKFRSDFLSDMSFKKIHLFESRKEAFSEDDVLQENIIYLAEKNKKYRKVSITSSVSSMIPSVSYKLDTDRLVHPDDGELFIRLAKDQAEVELKTALEGVSSSLEQLNIKVSTGRVVDFRTKENLKFEVTEDSIPLIYPLHFLDGFVRWPVVTAKKANGIVLNKETEKLLLPRGNYVLVRRFSSKEEPKRINSAIYDGTDFKATFVGFENHVNYFHINNMGIPIELAKGLSLYLSSTVVDRYFRQFNGLTQVNVSDLKSLPYPTHDELLEMGKQFGEIFPNQTQVDLIILQVLGIQAN